MSVLFSSSIPSQKKRREKKRRKRKREGEKGKRKEENMECHPRLKNGKTPAAYL